MCVESGAVAAVQVLHLGRAHQHMGLACGGIHVHQFAAIQIGQMLPIGRPCELVRRHADQRPMRKDRVDCKRLLGRLCGH
jgi:hypothetical protein